MAHQDSSGQKQCREERARSVSFSQAEKSCHPLRRVISGREETGYVGDAGVSPA